MAGLTEKQKYFLIFSLSASVLLLDQIAKSTVRRYLDPGQSVQVIQNIFHLTYVQNTGAGFGFFPGNTSLLVWFSAAAIALMIYFYKTIPSDRYAQSAAALVLGGALSNLIDRLFFSHVIDFFDLRIWPVFNIADMAITAGILILAVFILKKR